MALGKKIDSSKDRETGEEREREIGRQTSETCETIREMHTNFDANKASLWQIGSSVYYVF